MCEGSGHRHVASGHGEGAGITTYRHGHVVVVAVGGCDGAEEIADFSCGGNGYGSAFSSCRWICREATTCEAGSAGHRVGREVHRIGRRGHIASASANVGDGFQRGCRINGDGTGVLRAVVGWGAAIGGVVDGGTSGGTRDGHVLHRSVGACCD